MVKVRNSAAKISRNKKKYWRRGANIADVESFLDQKRDDERLEKHFKDLTQDQPAFVIDKTPNSAALISIPTKTVDEQKRVKRSKKDAKNISLLAALPQRCANSKQSGKPSRCWAPPRFFDLWNDEGTQTKDEDHELKECSSSETGLGSIKVPKTMRVPRSIRQHVDLPHAGTSYNPKVEDHQALLKKASLAEMARINKEKALRKAAAFPKRETRATEETDVQEMMEGLFDTSDANDFAESVATEGNDDSAKSVPVKPKSKAQRRRAALEKKMKAHLEKEKQNRVRENDVYRLKRIKKEIRKAEELSKKRQERKQLLKVKKLMGPARIGPHKFEPADEDFLLSSELPKGLRRLKPEGSILADRYRNLQLRNIIESRVRIKKKRRRPYKYVEKSAVRCVDEHYIPDNPLGINIR